MTSNFSVTAYVEADISFDMNNTVLHSQMRLGLVHVGMTDIHQCGAACWPRPLLAAPRVERRGKRKMKSHGWSDAVRDKCGYLICCGLYLPIETVHAPGDNINT